MSDSTPVMKVLETHVVPFPSGLDHKDVKGGWIDSTQYVWTTNGANIDLYSTETRRVEYSRSFSDIQTNKSLKITYVKEICNSEKVINLLLVGCSFKSSGTLFICLLPKLTTICCIALPSPVSCISTIISKSLPNDQFCDKLNMMSTILLVGMATGEVYAIDLKEHYIKNQLEGNRFVVNELKPSKLFIIRKNDDCQKVKQMSNGNDCHLALLINEHFCTYNKKLDFSVSSLLFNENINAIVIGYSTGHLQLWDCKVLQSVYILKKPKYDMPVTHITFLEPSVDPKNLCYLWVIQSDNSRLPNAMMIALTYEQRIMMSNGCFSYRVYKENCIKLEMSLWKETGFGRCISALSVCNNTLVKNGTGLSEHSEIKLFAMLMEICQGINTSSKSYIFLFDINQWYKAQMPSYLNHLEVSNSFSNFLKLPSNANYLDINISGKTLQSFGYYFKNNIEELYYPSLTYFECDCILDTEIIKFKHAGVQQEILDHLFLINWRLLIYPNLMFNQCLQANLRPFFWDKTDDYINYSLPDQVNFMVSILIENNIISIFNVCAEECKNGTYGSSEAMILLMQCLWNHFTLVKKYADQLCISLFDCSDKLLCERYESTLNYCLSQILHILCFYESLHSVDGIHILNVDLVYQEKIMKSATQYFHALIYFLNLKLLPKQIEEDSVCQNMQFDFTSLIQYSNKRRTEFGDLPLYLIDAVITNELKGYKLIEQWKQDCVKESKGLYPPSNIQSLLMVYLNTELSHTVKDFIITYFLIDACYLQKINETTTNLLSNIFNKNERLYKLCSASWFLDHDMFENAMLIFANYNECLFDDESWDWFHWNVMKLLVFKKQYYWAQIYSNLFVIKLINLDDHKFYVNLLIMNQNCFEALCYMHSRDMNEKNILFKYIFEQCRNTNQLHKILAYPLDENEKILFFSCLQEDNDTKLIQFKFLFQEKRYLEALELHKLLAKTKNVDITTVMMNTFKNMTLKDKRELNKKIDSDEEIKIMFMIDDLINIKNTTNIRRSNKSFIMNLIKPDVKYEDEDIDKLEKSDILDEATDEINSIELAITVNSEEQFKEPDDVILDEVADENNSVFHNNTFFELPSTTTNDIALNQVNTKKLTFANNECTNEVHKLQNIYVSASSKSSKSVIIKEFPQSNDEKNELPKLLTDTKMTTRSRSKQYNVVNGSLSTSSPTSEIIDDYLDIMPKKRSKRQKQNAKKKRTVKVQKSYPSASLKPSKSIIIKKCTQSNDEKNELPKLLTDTKMITRSRSKQYNMVNGSLSTSSPTSEIIDDYLDIMPKKRSKRQKQNAKKKRTVKVQKSYPSASLKPSKSIIIKKCTQSNDEKNELPKLLTDTKMITRSRSKQYNMVNGSSSTSSPTFEIIDDYLDIMPKKRSKRQKQNAKKKRTVKVQKSYPSASLKPSKSKIIKKCTQSNDEKNELSNLLTDTKMITRSRSKQYNMVNGSSSTSSPTSEIIDDYLNIMSKNRLKCQKKINYIKHEGVCQKSISVDDPKFKQEPTIVLEKFDVEAYKRSFQEQNSVWKIISYEVINNNNTIPKIRLKRFKNTH